MSIPEIETERLFLCAPAQDDFDVYRRFYADKVGSAAYGGPLNAEQAWRKLAYDIGHWTIRGFGMWSAYHKESGNMVGGAGLVYPQGWPCPELTWWITPDFRRQGLAMELSKAVIGFGYDHLEWDAVRTYMNDENIPARRLVEKLGGVVEKRRSFPDGLDRNIYILPQSS
ncbi:MAG: GNAT family N-acetyltransferase [Parasphingorhabdus sp.]